MLPWPLRGDADTLPDFHDLSNAGLKAFADECKDVNALEERRLGYVAFTRAKEILVATGHWWGPTQKRPRGPSSYLSTLKKHAGERVVAWAEQPELSEENPELAEQTQAPWPTPYDVTSYQRRLDAVALVQQARAEGPSQSRPRSRCCWTSRRRSRAGTPSSSDCCPRQGKAGAGRRTTWRCRPRCRRPR